MVKIEAIKVFLLKSLQASESFKSQKKPESEKNFTTPVDLPSAKSL